MEVIIRPKKRLFISLLMASLAIITSMAIAVWLVSFKGLAAINDVLPVVMAVLLITALAVAGLSILNVVFALLGIKTLPGFQNIAWIAINMLFPIAIVIGRIFDVEKEQIEHSFIEVSNHLVRQKKISVHPERLLILTPHCIQFESCVYKITRDPSNCKRCGKCQVNDLLDLTERYGVKLAVVTGGTLARRMIKQLRPQAIVAIACERDLTSGIQDVFPLPVVGVLNERPYGPCCNTKVSIKEVERIVRNFLGYK